jgi:hypothetical protein
MKHIVCHSGGHESALVGIEVARKFGAANTTLLNHDIPAHVEDADIKRFKREVADYIGLPITYASHPDPEAVARSPAPAGAQGDSLGDSTSRSGEDLQAREAGRA